MTKEEIRIGLLHEIMIECGYSKEEVSCIKTETISINGNYIVLYVDSVELPCEFTLKLETYMQYHNWWISIEREQQINDILKDD